MAQTGRLSAVHGAVGTYCEGLTASSILALEPLFPACGDRMWVIDTEACEKLCEVAAVFFLGSHKSPLCFPVSSVQRDEFVSAAATLVGTMIERHATQRNPGQHGAFRRRCRGL